MQSIEIDATVGVFFSFALFFPISFILACSLCCNNKCVNEFLKGINGNNTTNAHIDFVRNNGCTGNKNKTKKKRKKGKSQNEKNDVRECYIKWTVLLKVYWLVFISFLSIFFTTPFLVHCIRLCFIWVFVVSSSFFFVLFYFVDSVFLL